MDVVPVGLLAMVAIVVARWLDGWEKRQRALPRVDPPPITGGRWIRPRRAPVPLWAVIVALVVVYLVAWNLTTR